MRNLKIGFVDTFDGAPQFFMDTLYKIYDRSLIIRDDENPDILFFGDSNFGNVNRQQKYLDVPVRIFYTGENVRPNGQIANYGLGFDHIYNDNYMRLPLWVLNIHYLQNRFNIVALKHNVADIIEMPFEMPFERKFCGFVQSNPNCEPRNRLFHLISNEISQIDSAGPLFNNVGFVLPRGEDGVLQKLHWLGEYMFTLAAENGQYPGYITEKLLEAKLAGTVPIYYGSETVSMDFNPKSFIDRGRFSSDEEFIEYIRECHSNVNLYHSYFDAPLFDEERLDHYYQIMSNLTNFLRNIVGRHFEWL